MQREHMVRPVALDPLDAYALWAQAYPPRAHNAFMKAEERAMLSLLPARLSGAILLDVGCGSGRYAHHAILRGARRTVGLDVSPEMLARARLDMPQSGADHLRLVRASLAVLPVRNCCANVTVCALAIGHLPHLPSALAELRRATSADGAILVSDFHPDAVARGSRRTFTLGDMLYEVRHTPHSKRDWHVACETLGLRIDAMLEPCIDARDVPAGAHFDAESLSAPAVLVLKLSRPA